MNKSNATLMLHSFFGMIVFLILALINQKVSGQGVNISLMIIPAVVGLVIGGIVGLSKNKWIQKCVELDRAAIELEEQLAFVVKQKDKTDNLERLVTNIPLPVYLKNINHQYILANSHFEKLSAKSWNEIKGKTDEDIFPEPIADLFREQDMEIISAKTSKTFEETVPLASGILTFETYKFPVLDDMSNVVGVGGVCTEITQLKETEDRLKTEEARLTTVLSHLETGVITSDVGGNITMLNRKAAELIGVNIVPVKGSKLDDVYKVQDAKSGAALQLEPIDYSLGPQAAAKRRVIIITESGEAKELIQQLVTLKDGFGQAAGLLIVIEEAANQMMNQDDQKYTRSKESETYYGLSEAQNSSGLILVMDDDRLVRKTTSLMLSRGGYEVITAKEGQEAIDLYTKHLNTDHPISAVIMDLTVPGGMGGVEATGKILSIDPQARILVASGYSTNPILANFLAHGFMARVEKPFDLNALLVTIKNILN